MKKVTLFKTLFLITFFSVHMNISAQVVISQIYGGGGNTGATYKNDFIELYNRGENPVSLKGWSIQYASSAGTTWSNTTILPEITLNPGQYYLVQEATGGNVGINLPTPDLSGTINLSATAGKVAFCNSVTSLTAADFNAPQPTGLTIIDFVGFGTANCYEGTGTAPAGSNTTAIIRNLGGLTDTNNNSVDFSTGAPTPRNTVFTSTHNPTSSSFSVTVSGKNLVVKNVANGSKVEIFTALGSKVQTSELSSGSVVLNNLSKGMYIVRIGKLTQKITL